MEEKGDGEKEGDEEDTPQIEEYMEEPLMAQLAGKTLLQDADALPMPSIKGNHSRHHHHHRKGIDAKSMPSKDHNHLLLLMSRHFSKGIGKTHKYQSALQKLGITKKALIF